MGEVQWLVAVAHVDINLGQGVAGEPSRLQRDGSTFERPVRSVLRCWHSAARIHPLHAIRKSAGAVGGIGDANGAWENGRIIWREGSICDDVVSSPSWIHDDSVCCGQRRPGGDEINELCETKHGGEADTSKRCVAAKTPKDECDDGDDVPRIAGPNFSLLHFFFFTL